MIVAQIALKFAAPIRISLTRERTEKSDSTEKMRNEE
jgi:hypothetical protein